MLKKNKIKVIISSIIILLPALFGIIMWNDLPDIITTHWGADGNADGFKRKGLLLSFGTPIILFDFSIFVCFAFYFHWIKTKRSKSKSIGNGFFGFFRLYPFFANGIMYRAAFWQRI